VGIIGIVGTPDVSFITDANLAIESHCQQVPLVTKYPRLTKKSKFSFKMPFFPNILLPKILGCGRVAFNKNVFGGKGILAFACIRCKKNSKLGILSTELRKYS
jgi:hypothetical protein